MGNEVLNGGTISSPRIFFLSPANCGGKRARLVTSPSAEFDLARQLRTSAGAPLGDVFAFVSGLYFRGKLAYARRFANPPDPTDRLVGHGVLVITPNAGLRAADTPVTATSLRVFAEADIHVDNSAYRRTLEQSARAVVDAVGSDCEVVLLGSIASPKYVDVLLPLFGEKLLFPTTFVGRGDMSRGALMLRHAASRVELEYAPVAGAVRHGPRPPKLGSVGL